MRPTGNWKTQVQSPVGCAVFFRLIKLTVHICWIEKKEGSYIRVHVDFTGPFLGPMLLLLVDAHFKWPEVIAINSTTAAKTIGCPERFSHAMPFRNNLFPIKGLSLSAMNFVTFCKPVAHSTSEVLPTTLQPTASLSASCRLSNTQCAKAAHL